MYMHIIAMGTEWAPASMLVDDWLTSVHLSIMNMNSIPLFMRTHAHTHAHTHTVPKVTKAYVTSLRRAFREQDSFNPTAERLEGSIPIPTTNPEMETQIFWRQDKRLENKAGKLPYTTACISSG